MPVINFMPEFADLVKSGGKTTTIRRLRDRPISVGNTLHLYTGTRTKNSRKLGVGLCTSVKPIDISALEGFVPHVLIDSEVLDDSQYKNLISKDGFSESDDFLNFFKDRYGLPFSGVLIEWNIQ